MQPLLYAYFNPTPNQFFFQINPVDGLTGNRIGICSGTRIKKTNGPRIERMCSIFLIRNTSRTHRSTTTYKSSFQLSPEKCSDTRLPHGRIALTQVHQILLYVTPARQYSYYCILLLCFENGKTLETCFQTRGDEALKTIFLFRNTISVRPVFKFFFFRQRYNYIRTRRTSSKFRGFNKFIRGKNKVFIDALGYRM